MRLINVYHSIIAMLLIRFSALHRDSQHKRTMLFVTRDKSLVGTF